MIIATIEPPYGLNTIGSPKLIEERICRPKENMRMLQGTERRAILVSESIFFMEYHLHSQLINKLKYMGKNSIFSLKISIRVSD